MIKWLLSFLLTAGWAHASSKVESFTSSTHLFDAGGMVWNIGRGELHPPLRVVGWDDGGGAQTTGFSVGDGRHGAFVASRYHVFDQNGVITAGVIEIDTDVYPELQFTEFDLDAGYVLRPVGSQPLLIRSQTDILIDGIIDCSGGEGADASADPTLSLSGGAARCGGGDGGDSVPAGAAPAASHAGRAGGTLVTGGGAGPIQLATGGQGGGGGGGYVKTFVGGMDKPNPTNGDNSVGGAGGVAGTIYQDDSFSDDPTGAGSGGGGGSGYDNVADAPAHSSGGSGGAGGGFIFLYAVDGVEVGVTGEIHADGGDGGSALAGKKGGGGGGGAGGSIVIWSGDSIQLDGPVTAAPGVGGTSTGGDGGTGAWGRTWIVEPNGFAGGAFIENPDTNLLQPGTVRFETGVDYTVTSTAIDLGSTQPLLTGSTTTIADQGTSPFTYQLAFGERSAIAGLADFAVDTTYLNQSVTRFVRFQIQTRNLDALTPIRIQQVEWQYQAFEQNEFDFVTGCGQVGAPPPHLPMGLAFMLLPLLLILVLRYQSKRRCNPVES